jgi:hypothetical protein
MMFVVALLAINAALVRYHVGLYWWYQKGCPGGHSPRFVVDLVDRAIRKSDYKPKYWHLNKVSYKGKQRWETKEVLR